jgi:hypothetical protein
MRENKCQLVALEVTGAPKKREMPVGIKGKAGGTQHMVVIIDRAG